MLFNKEELVLQLRDLQPGGAHPLPGKRVGYPKRPIDSQIVRRKDRVDVVEGQIGRMLIRRCPGFVRFVPVGVLVAPEPPYGWHGLRSTGPALNRDML